VRGPARAVRGPARAGPAVIACAAICPAPPLLARELTGRDSVVPELREACAAAVARLAGSAPDAIAVVGTADRTARWPTDWEPDLAGFAPALGPRSGLPLPLPLGLGMRLLDEAGYPRRRRWLQSVGHDEPGPACLELGSRLSGLAGRVGLLVMADGTARRSLRAPGHLDPRAAGFDAAIERAVRDGEPGALRDMDVGLASELLVTGRPAWQVLAGAMPGPVPGAEILYCDDPFGVFYLVGWLSAPSRPVPEG
jgi:hypothetical protein